MVKAMKIEENIMFIRLNFGLPRQRRKVIAEAEKIDPKRLTASARLYSGKAFKEITNFEMNTRAELMQLAIDIPACFRGSYVLPSKLIDFVSALLEGKRKEREALIDDFLKKGYATEREEARKALGNTFHEEDFPEPSVIRNHFTMDWSIFQMKVPEGLPKKVLEKERAKFQNQMNEVFVQCRSALREAMADLVGHLAERLAPDSNGERKKLHASAVENLKVFLDTVNARDITSDEAIRNLSEKAKALLAPYSVADLKGSGVATKVRSELKNIKKELDGLISREGGRKIDLDME